MWGSKTSKVHYDKVIQDYEKGGLKLIDLNAKDQSMKISWVPKLILRPEMGMIAYYDLLIQSPLIWQCNTHLKDIPKTNYHLLAVQSWMA